MIDLTINKQLPLNVVFYEDTSASFTSKAYVFDFTVQADRETDITDTEIQLGQIITVNKCILFLEDYVDNALVTDDDGLSFVKDLIAAGSDNNMVVIPHATDACFLAALFSKLNVLCAPGMKILSARLRDVRDGTTLTVEGDTPSAGLPDTAKWVGNFPYWPEPWWTRHDVITYDNYAESIEEFERWQERFVADDIPAQSAAPLADLEQQIREAFDEIREPAEIINLGALR